MPLFKPNTGMKKKLWSLKYTYLAILGYQQWELGEQQLLLSLDRLRHCVLAYGWISRKIRILNHCFVFFAKASRKQCIDANSCACSDCNHQVLHRKCKGHRRQCILADSWNENTRWFFMTQTDDPLLVEYGYNYLSIVMIFSFGLYGQLLWRKSSEA